MSLLMTLTSVTAAAQSNDKNSLIITQEAFRQMSVDIAKKDTLQEALEQSKKRVDELETRQMLIYPVAGTLAGIILGLLIGNKLK